MTKELTKAQLERQDFVDNVIYNTIRELNPSQGKIGRLGWDIGRISEVREVIQRMYKDAGYSEMSFYPYIREVKP